MQGGRFVPLGSVAFLLATLEVSGYAPHQTCRTHASRRRSSAAPAPQAQLTRQGQSRRWQPEGSRASHPGSHDKPGALMHLTLVEIYPAMSAAAVAWLMIRMSQANGLARLRTPPRCAAC